MRGQAGFTLLELLLVMAILGLAVIALPYVFGAGEGARFRAGVQAMARGLAAIRADAIRQGAEAPVDESDRRLASLPPGTRMSYESEVPPLVGEVSQRLVFFPDGSSTGGRLVLTRGPTRIVLRINPLSGRIAIDG